MTERQILAQVRSPFIVDMQFAFQTDEKLYLVMEFVAGGELFTYIQLQKRQNQISALSEEVIRFYAAEIVIALQHIHELGIVYRDLKPENVLVGADGHIKLTDFGLSKSNPNAENLTFTVCGTPEYIAPEVIKNHGHNKNIDYWSLGILLYELYTSQTPFHGAGIQDIFKTLKSDAPMDLSQLLNASENFISLVAMLLEKDENFRLGTNNPEDIMNHPFFSGIDWNEAAN